MNFQEKQRIFQILDSNVESKRKGSKSIHNLTSKYVLKKTSANKIRKISQELYNTASEQYNNVLKPPYTKQDNIDYIRGLIGSLEDPNNSGEYFDTEQDEVPESVESFIQKHFAGPGEDEKRTIVEYAYVLDSDKYEKGDMDIELLTNVLKYFLDKYANNNPEDKLKILFKAENEFDLMFKTIDKEKAEKMLSSQDLFEYNIFSDSAYKQKLVPVASSFIVIHHKIEGKGLEEVDLTQYNDSVAYRRNNYKIDILDNIAKVLCPKCTSDCFVQIFKKIYPCGKMKTSEIKRMIKERTGISLGKSCEVNEANKILKSFKLNAAICSSVYYGYKVNTQPTKLEVAKDLYGYQLRRTLKYNTICKTQEVDKNTKIIILRDGHYYLLRKTLEPKECKSTGVPLCNKAKSKYVDPRTLAKFLLESEIISRNVHDRLMSEDFRMTPKKEKKSTTKLFCFDYETVYDHTGHLKPYSIAYSIFGQIDLEGNFQRINSEVKFSTSSKMTLELVDYISKNKNWDEEAILIGYNNNNFDNYVMADELNQMEKLNTEQLVFSGTSILELRSGRIKTLDLCKMVVNSLKNACEAFKINMAKGYLNHNDYQDQFEKLLKKTNYDTNKAIKQMRHLASKDKKLITYNKRDIESTQELFIKVREEMKRLTNLDLEKYMTIGQLCLQYHKNKIPQYCLQGQIETQEDYQFIRDSFIGGRAQAFRKGEYELEDDYIESVDVKSLYPYIMKNMPFPIGDYKYTSGYVDNKMGIYRVTNIDQSNLVTKIVPIKDQDGILQWNKDFIPERNLTSVDIEALVRNNCSLEVKEGIYWEECSDEVFKHFVVSMETEKNKQDNLKKEKSNEYNPALRNIAKLFLNNLSGKVGQRQFEDNTSIIRTKQEAEDFIGKHHNYLFEESKNLIIATGKKKKPFNKNTCKPCFNAAFIYSYSRLHMYESILKWSSQKFQMDTDSCFLPNRELHDIISKSLPKPDYWFSRKVDNFAIFKLGSRFGDFERENDEKLPNLGFFIAPKHYCMINKETRQSKMGSKGISMTKTKYIEEDQIEEFKELDVISQREKYKNFKEVAEEIYKVLIDNGKTHLVCPQIYKNKSSLRLEQIFRVKKITYTQD